MYVNVITLLNGKLQFHTIIRGVPGIHMHYVIIIITDRDIDGKTPNEIWNTIAKIMGYSRLSGLYNYEYVLVITSHVMIRTGHVWSAAAYCTEEHDRVHECQ